MRVREGVVVESSLRIYEPPRFFEAFLRGRRFTEAPDITARICGICPVAYQMSAVQAMEEACGVTVDGQLRALRRLLYCGEWIESHALHVHLLHAPDFLGYESGIHMARDHAAIVKRGLQLKKVGNELMTLIGGREIHPINVRVGGFYRAPERAELAPSRSGSSGRSMPRSKPCDGWRTFRFPDVRARVRVRRAARTPTSTRCSTGASSRAVGSTSRPRSTRSTSPRSTCTHSNALHSTLRDRGTYLVGPLARYNLNFDHLAPVAQEAALADGLGRTCRNPFKSIIVRAVETCRPSWRRCGIIDCLRAAGSAGGAGANRARRSAHGAARRRAACSTTGTASRRTGSIAEAKIVPPTAQNQAMIEGDLRRSSNGISAWTIRR